MAKKTKLANLIKKKEWRRKPVLDFTIIFAVILVIAFIVLFPYIKKEFFETPAAPRTLEERLKPGTIGEEETLAPIPSIVSNTTGIISKIESNRLIIQGSGSNFADQKPRTLTLIFTDSTITKKLGTKVEYQGLQGLKQLKAGMTISIMGAENLRAKTEFEAEYIIF